ncbi:(2Fe-2S)-binding protein [bacterium]|jgi:isoquinoline 1-oxidoreductase alpha subunit|nr:(2Fe-2S)-binding protein [bacterium]
MRVNGVTRSVAVDWQNETLLSVLREFLNLPGSRYSCGIGQCGACTVHIEGQPVASCVTPVSAAQNKDVLTIEGLASADGELHPLQQAWIEESVPQCGYCQSGQIMQALALLNEQPDPSEVEIVRSMSGNLCRCGTYDRIKKAIRSAAQTMREAT